jgi:hypothetical protein
MTNLSYTRPISKVIQMSNRIEHSLPEHIRRERLGLGIRQLGEVQSECPFGVGVAADDLKDLVGEDGLDSSFDFVEFGNAAVVHPLETYSEWPSEYFGLYGTSCDGVE